MARKIFSFDAETNGLWGRAFSVAAVLYGADGGEEVRFVGRCPIDGQVNPWVEGNVLPEMADILETHDSYEALLGAFVEFYLAHKGEDVDIIVHMGLPVEARLFLDAHNLGILGDWDAPFPLVDIAAFPEVGTSVDSYNESHGISVSAAEFAGGTHNPLFDSAQAAAAYRHIMGW
jgi:hypothetical protein